MTEVFFRRPSQKAITVFAALAAAIALGADGLDATPAYGTGNLALGAKYDWSDPPNYGRLKSPKDHEKLTDGRSAGGRFWLDREAAIGWEKRGAITLDLDLEKSAAIGRVCIGTARDQGSEVHYPFRIAAFSSLDEKSYRFLGAAFPAAEKGDGGYEKAHFCLSGAERPARHLRLHIIPKGPYLFLDEIEMAAAAAGEPPVAERISAGLLADRLLRSGAIDVKRLALREEALRIAATLGAHPGAKTAEAIAAALLVSSLGEADPAGERLEQFERDLFALRVPALTGGGVLQAWWADPFANATRHAEPPASSACRFEPQPGGITALALNLLATEDVETQIRIRRNGALSGAAAGPRITPARVDYAFSAHGALARGDALIPLGEGRMRLSKGRTEQVFFTIETIPADRETQIVIELTDRAGNMLAVRPCTIPKAAFTPESAMPIAGFVWSYLSGLPAEINSADAARDLNQLGINMAAIPARDLNLGGPSRSSVGAGFEVLSNYVTAHGPNADYVLYLEINAARNAGRFGTAAPGSPGWNSAFTAWLDLAIDHLQHMGISEERIFIYPVDEPKLASEFEWLARIGALVTQARPKVRLLTTIANEVPASSAPALAHIDRVFLLETLAGSAVHQMLKSRGIAVAFYSITCGLKAASPRDILHLGWKALRHDADGLGCWAYADVRGESPWSDYDGNREDFSLIYWQDGKIIASKRHVAFRMALANVAAMKALERREPARAKAMIEAGFARVAP